MRLPLAALSLAASLTACRGPDGPAERYRAFAAAARSGDSAKVWSMLSERSRLAFDERARAVAARAPRGVVSGAGRQIVLGDLASIAPRAASVAVVAETRDSAVVKVEPEGGGPAGEVALVRERGAWRVVVPFDNQPPRR